MATEKKLGGPDSAARPKMKREWRARPSVHATPGSEGILLPDLSPPDVVPRNLPRTAWQGGSYPGHVVERPHDPFPHPEQGTAGDVEALWSAGRQPLPVDVVIRNVEAVSTMHQPAYIARYKAAILDWLQRRKEQT